MAETHSAEKDRRVDRLWMIGTFGAIALMFWAIAEHIWWLFIPTLLAICITLLYLDADGSRPNTDPGERWD